MERRLELHEKFKTLLNSNFVYFQPPSTLKLNYPCIIYKRDAQDENFADNTLYNKMKRYLVTVVDKDPDSDIPDKILDFQYCSYVDQYTIDNLNHDVYSLYY